MTIKIRSVVFCDVIRQEVSGKFILVGAYQKEINFRKLPEKFSGFFWLEVEPWASEQLDFEIRIDLPGKKAAKQVELSFRVADQKNEGDESTIIIQMTPVEIETTGDLSLYIRKKGDKKWQLATTKKIGLVEQLPRS